MKSFSRKIFSGIFILTLLLSNAGQVWADTSFAWVKGFSSTETEEPDEINVDSQGNVYTVGIFDDTVDFDPGAGTSNMTSSGSYDIFISKLDSSGNFVWAKKIGNTGGDQSYSSKLDSSGNLYITGSFEDTVDFDPGAGTNNVTSNGYFDIFILKLDSSGNFVWVKTVGGSNDDRGMSIQLDSSNNIYVTGYFLGTADFDPGVGTSDLINSSIYTGDVFILKLNSSGNFVWAKSFGSVTDHDEGKDIKVDSSGNVYTVGYFQNTGDFDPGAGTSTLTLVGNSDAFISKLDSSGNFVWAKSIGGTGYETPYSLIFDSLGNLYISGAFSETVDFDPGAGTTNITANGDSNAFISKLDSSGNFVWVKSFGSAGYTEISSSVVDSFNDLYFTGFFEGTVDFDPGAGTNNVTTSGDGDGFVLKLDSSGDFILVKSFGGSGYVYPQSIYIDSSNSLYLAGYFDTSADFDPGAGISTLNSSGNNDTFILKLSQLSTPTTTTQPSSSITTTTATLNGNITDTGGEANTERGFDIGTDNTYTMTDIEDATGSYSTGAYSLTATGLTCGTTYHYRAYSTNSSGTGTGSDQEFTTSACPSTSTSSSTSSTSASARAQNLINMGKVQEAQTIINQFPTQTQDVNLNTNNTNPTTPKPTTTPTVRKGNRNNTVKYIQEYLKIKADGIFGPITQSAVMKFQKQHNLVPDGVVGPRTWNVIK